MLVLGELDGMKKSHGLKSEFVLLEPRITDGTQSLKDLSFGTFTTPANSGDQPGHQAQGGSPATTQAGPQGPKAAVQVLSNLFLEP